MARGPGDCRRGSILVRGCCRVLFFGAARTYEPHFVPVVRGLPFGFCAAESLDEAFSGVASPAAGGEMSAMRGRGTLRDGGPAGYAYLYGLPGLRTPGGYGIQRSLQPKDGREVFDVLQLGVTEDGNYCSCAAARGRQEEIVARRSEFRSQRGTIRIPARRRRRCRRFGAGGHREMARRILIIMLSALVVAGVSLEVYGAKRLWDLINAPPPPDPWPIVPLQVPAERSANATIPRNALSERDFRSL